jgi:hypothetical protein
LTPWSVLADIERLLLPEHLRTRVVMPGEKRYTSDKAQRDVPLSSGVPDSTMMIFP